jgi:hypothetical protein
MISYTRIPANTDESCWKHDNKETKEEVTEQIAFDKRWRPGNSIFVNGVCAHVGEASGHTLGQIEELEAKIIASPKYSASAVCPHTPRKPAGSFLSGDR